MFAVLLPALISACPPCSGETGEGPVYYRDIKPLLDLHCTGCHSQEKLSKRSASGGLALDSLEAVLKGGKEPVVAPGKPEGSELIARLREPDPDLRMPRDAEPLRQSEIELLERWIGAGAPAGEPEKRSAGAAQAAEVPRPRVRPKRPRDLALASGGKLPGGPIAGLAGEFPAGQLELRIRIAPLPPVAAVAYGAAPAGGAAAGGGAGKAGVEELLAAGGYGTATIWNARAGEAIAALTDIPGTVHALAFSPDGRLLAAGGGLPGHPGIAAIYETAGWKLRHRLEGHHEVVLALAWSPDGGRLATGSYDKTAAVWDPETGERVLAIQDHSDAVYGVAFLGGGVLASAGADRSVKLTDLASGKGVQSLSSHQMGVLALAASPDGKALVSAGIEPELRFWDISSGKVLRTAGGHSGRVEALVFSRDSTRLASAGQDRTVRIWNARSGAREKELAGASEWLYAVDFSPGGARAAAGAWDGTLRIWDIASGRLLAALIQPPVLEGASPEWAIALPEGYFRASAELEEAARLAAPGGAEIPAAALRPVLGRRDRIAAALGGEPVPPPFFPRRRAF